MAYPVRVMLKSQSVQDESDAQEKPVRVFTTGTIEQNSDTYTLRYQESDTDEETGRVVTQDVQLELHPSRVVMTRIGDFGTSMVFEKDRRFEGLYHTPYGDLDMAVFPTHVNCSLTPERGTVHLHYQLDMQGSFTAMHDLQIDYRAQSGPAPC